MSVSEAGKTLSSRHVSSCDVTRAVGDVRSDLTLNSMAQIHAFVTLLTSRDLTWSSGQHTCQHVSETRAGTCARPELQVRSRDVNRVTKA